MMKYAFLFLPLFAIACGGNTETEVVEDPAVEVVDPATTMNTMPEDEGMISINETVDAVNNVGGDITALPASAAVSVIDSWSAKLASMPGTEGMVADLNSLKMELTAANIDGEKVGALLSKLGNETAAMAPDNQALSGLASALNAGGAKLSGM